MSYENRCIVILYFNGFFSSSARTFICAVKCISSLSSTNKYSGRLHRTQQQSICTYKYFRLAMFCLAVFPFLLLYFALLFGCLCDISRIALTQLSPLWRYATFAQAASISYLEQMKTVLRLEINFAWSTDHSAILF